MNVVMKCPTDGVRLTRVPRSRAK